MKYVIIGNSAAGIGAVEGIRRVDKNGEITVITNEHRHTYSRPLISYYLSGKISEEQMKYRPDNFYAVSNCELIYAEAVNIDPDKKDVSLADGRIIAYDKLLTATGSTAFVPEISGLETVDEKYTFMNFSDADKINTVIDKNKRVLIIGAGLIGLKCAEGISDRVSHITVVDLVSKILSSILDDEGSVIVRKHLEKSGLEFRLSSSVKRFEKNTAVLDSGETLEFDVLILAVGVRPNVKLLKGIAEIDRGIMINNKSETSVFDIYAAGDCTQTFDVSDGRNKVMALLPNAYMQGECAGINMAGGDIIFGKAMLMNAIGFFGLHIITAGTYNGNIYAEKEDDNYKKLFYSGGKLNGYILIGDIGKAGIYTNLIREQTRLDTIDFALVCRKPGLMAFTEEYRKEKLGGAR